MQHGEEMFPEVISQSVAYITDVNHLKAFTGRGTVDEAVLCARKMSCNRTVITPPGIPIDVYFVDRLM